MKFGDGNTKFFHAQTVIRRKRNKIDGLFLADGTWSVDAATIKNKAFNYFHDLFASVENVNPTSLVTDMTKNIGQDCADNLTREVSKKEVWDTLKVMKSLKATGLDGFQPFFFKHYWHLIGDDIFEVVKQAFRDGKFDESLSETLIVLIRKRIIPRK